MVGCKEWSLLRTKASMGPARVALSLGGKRRSQGRRGGGSAVLSERLKAGAVGLFSSGYGRTQPYPEIRAGILLLLTVDDMATLLAIRMAILHATAGNCIRISEHRITRVS